MPRRGGPWVIAIAIALLAAACGTDAPSTETSATSSTSTTSTAPAGSAPDESTTSTTSTVAPLTASFRGVTEDTIELGIASVDFDQLLDLGFIDFNYGDQVAIWEALLAAVNDDGGIFGRRLTAVYDSYLPVGNVEAEKSCLFFTEDNEVFAVLGLWIGDSVLCLTETHETIHVGQLMRQEWIDRSIAPLLSPGMAEERGLEALLSVLSQTGRLDGKTVAVLTQSTAESTIDTVVRPFLEANDIEMATVGILSDTAGDLLAVEGEVQNLTERWRVDGADFLLVVGPNGMGSIPQIRDALGVIDVAVTGSQTFQTIAAAAPDEDKTGFEGVLALAGLSPTDGEQFNEPLLNECIRTVEAAIPGLEVVPSNEQIGPEDWYAGIRDSCSSLAVFVAAAKAAGPELTNESFRAGAESLGAIQLPGQAFSSFGPGKFDGEDGFRLVEFDPFDGEEGSFTALTDIVDAAAAG
jgi:hypothetical protein